MKEAQIQQRICEAIRAKYPSCWIDQNPLSELQIPGPDAYRFKLIADLKARGWEPGRPDLIVIIPAQFGHRVFALEVKTPKQNPFRPYPGGGTWIEKTKDRKKMMHVLRQISHLEMLAKKQFDFCGFVHSVEGVLAAISGDAKFFGQTQNGIRYELLSKNRNHSH
jgi:hypothetical protein